MIDQKKARVCEGGDTLVFPCSGAADVGEIADRAARDLTTQGLGKMFCLAGIGGNVSGIMATAKGADQIVVIDGCNLDCAKRTLEERGFKTFNHLRVTDLGLEKSKSPANKEAIGIIVDEARKVMGT
jgi:uncharacterized metal-binding protein